MLFARAPVVPTTADIFGNALRRLRNRCGISQKELAARAGLSASFIAHMEVGRKPPNIEAVVKMARAMNVPVRALVEDFDAPDGAATRHPIRLTR
jgi:transcriptional regulator with XRE-family HTH domain